MAERHISRFHHLKKQFMIVSRWLHIYLSMGSFAILFFFAVTGLTLNHLDWFANQQRTVASKGRLELAWLKPPAGKELAKLEIVEQLRKAHGVRGAMNDFRVEESQVAVSFKGPGYMADAFIDRESGNYELSETRMGLVAVMNDLHKGRDSGRVWGWMIDLSAVLMALVSLTGLALIFFLSKRRVSGLVIAGMGAVVCYAAYLIWAP